MSVTIIVKDAAHFKYRPSPGEQKQMRENLKGRRKKGRGVTIPERALREIPPEARRDPKLLKAWAERSGWK